MTVRLFTLLVFLLLTGCSLAPHILYKIDVQQGNVVTEEMVEKLRPDMTKSQVRFVMGSPLVVDPFRNDRWDYAYIQRIKGDLVEQTRLTIYFKDDRLIRIEKQEIFSRGKKKPKQKPEAGQESDSSVNSQPEPSQPQTEHANMPETVD